MGRWGRAQLLLAAALASAACGGLTACGDDDPPATAGAGGAGGSGGASGASGGGGTTGASGGGGAGEPVERTDFELGAPETLAADQAFPRRLALAGDRLYFTEAGDFEAATGSVASIPKQGGELELLATEQDEPTGVVVLAGDVYWANRGPSNMASGSINLRKPDGATEILFLADEPLELLPTAVGVFWIQLRGKLMWGPSGGAPETLAGDLRSPIRMLAEGERIFVVEQGTEGETDGRVRAWTMGDSTPTTIADGLAGPQAIAIRDGELFMTCSGDGTVKAVRLDDGSERVLAEGQDEPFGIAVDAVSVYFTNRASHMNACDAIGTLNKVPLAGGAVETLATDMRCPSSIAVDNTGIYWVVNGGLNDNGDPVGDGSVQRIPKSYR